MGVLKTVFGSLIEPVANFFTKRSDNKTEIALSKIDRIKNSDNALATWEAIQAEGGSGSWKDEYITLIITLPIPAIFFSVIASVIFDEPIYAESVNQGVEAIRVILPNYEDIVIAVCLAAIGIRALKSK